MLCYCRFVNFITRCGSFLCRSGECASTHFVSLVICSLNLVLNKRPVSPIVRQLEQLSVDSVIERNHLDQEGRHRHELTRTRGITNCSRSMLSYSSLKTGNPARTRMTSLGLLHNNPAEWLCQSWVNKTPDRCRNILWVKIFLFYWICILENIFLQYYGIDLYWICHYGLTPPNNSPIPYFNKY